MKITRLVFCLGWLIFSAPIFAQKSTVPPGEFLPHRPGEQFTRNDQLTDYFKYLAENHPQTMKLERYGLTNEDRPLQIAIFSSPENMLKLEAIRLNNLRLAGLAEGKFDLTSPVVIVWLSMSVHGNEAAGTECSPELAFRLAVQADPEIQKWLKNTVVILDPSLNPDGNSRYTNWCRGVSNRIPNPNQNAREHREQWESGRTNHYYFDLNRDWAWASQAESQQRLAIYHQWLPHVHPDLHEQGYDEPYYFAPAAEPLHEFITPWQRNFQIKIGQNHAKYFDQKGWMYFSGEVFDLFYPSYGDTYPMYNGAIGMTYEQGGIGAGRSILLENGDTLKLADRIAHHLTTAISTIEISSLNAPELVRNFQEYYQNSATKPPGKYHSYIVRAATNNPNKINALCELLDRHHIYYGVAGKYHPSVKAFEYASGNEVSANIQAEDLVINAFQPHGLMLQVLMDAESKLVDSLTYDITAWSLPHAFGLDMLACQKRIEPEAKRPIYRSLDVNGSVKPYSWAIERGSLAEAKFLGELLQEGIQIRYATKDFAVGEKKFAAGSFVVSRADNMDLDFGLDKMVRAAAVRHNVTVTPILSGWMGGKGRDLGSDAYQLIEKPEVAIVFGDEVDDNSFGHTWFYFEHDIEYPVSAVPLDKINFSLLDGFNTLVFPHGRYNLDEKQLETIVEWVKNGGRLIGFEGGAKAFAGKDDFELKIKEDKKDDSTSFLHTPFSSKDRDGISDQTPGAVVRAKMDDTHPLGYGMGGHYFSLKTSPTAFDFLKNGQTVAWLDDKYESYGFIGSKLKPRLEKTFLAGVQKMGRGEAVFFADNVLFRSFWYQGEVFFFNSLIF